MTVHTVTGSSRMSAPAATATAGLTYVIVVARTGPISPTSANSIRNAAAVQIVASSTTDQTTSAEGTVDGMPSPTRTIGMYATAVTLSAEAITPMPDRLP